MKKYLCKGLNDFKIVQLKNVDFVFSKSFIVKTKKQGTKLVYFSIMQKQKIARHIYYLIMWTVFPIAS